MIRRLLALAFVFLTIPLLAQATRTISRIEVRGDVPAKLIVSQTALIEGRAYSDRDLEIAVARIRRLPFVYDARYTIQGETLIFEVDAMTRFFAAVDAAGMSLPNGRATGAATVGGGARFFAGSNGIAEVNVTKLLAEGGDARVLGAEYSHYGIAGTRLFATAAIGQSFIGNEGFNADPNWQLTVGYPLTLRQTLTASAMGEGFSRQRTFGDATDIPRTSSTQRVFNLRWSYDTSDDPFFARQGEVIHATPSWTSRKSQSVGIVVTFPGNVVSYRTLRTEGSVTALNFDATKFWAMGERNVIFSSLNASREHSDLKIINNGVPLPSPDDSNAVALTLGIACNLFDWNTPLTSARQRFEFGVRASRHSLTDGLTTGVTAGWTLRRQYMNVKLNLAYDFE